MYPKLEEGQEKQECSKMHRNIRKVTESYKTNF